MAGVIDVGRRPKQHQPTFPLPVMAPRQVVCRTAPRRKPRGRRTRAKGPRSSSNAAWDGLEGARPDPHGRHLRSTSRPVLSRAVSSPFGAALISLYLQYWFWLPEILRRPVDRRRANGGSTGQRGIAALATCPGIPLAENGCRGGAGPRQMSSGGAVSCFGLVRTRVPAVVR